MLSPCTPVVWPRRITGRLQLFAALFAPGMTCTVDSRSRQTQACVQVLKPPHSPFACLAVQLVPMDQGPGFASQASSNLRDSDEHDAGICARLLLVKCDLSCPVNLLHHAESCLPVLKPSCRGNQRPNGTHARRENEGVICLALGSRWLEPMKLPKLNILLSLRDTERPLRPHQHKPKLCCSRTLSKP